MFSVRYCPLWLSSPLSSQAGSALDLCFARSNNKQPSTNNCVPCTPPPISAFQRLLPQRPEGTRFSHPSLRSGHAFGAPSTRSLRGVGPSGPEAALRQLFPLVFFPDRGGHHWSRTTHPNILTSCSMSPPSEKRTAALSFPQYLNSTLNPFCFTPSNESYAQTVPGLELWNG